MFKLKEIIFKNTERYTGKMRVHIILESDPIGYMPDLIEIIKQLEKKKMISMKGKK